MAKKLGVIAFVAVELMLCGVADAKVCRLGDPGCVGQYGDLLGTCDADSYTVCNNPRAGAPYCIDKSGSNGSVVRKFSPNDCCDSFKECDLAQHEEGYGASCLGEDNVRRWANCGCAYGFVSQNQITDTITGELPEDNLEVPYEERCYFLDKTFGSEDQCKFASCQNARRWFYQSSGEHCAYRLDTRCGGFGCRQLYNCNNLINGNEYYRNDAIYLDNNNTILNFINFDSDDPLSNEHIPNQQIYSNDGYGGQVANSALIEGYNGDYITSTYELTNKIVCAYETDYDNPTGYDCNGVPNYCYKFNTADVCNQARGWYRESIGDPIHAAIIYYDNAYLPWLGLVEKNADYLHGKIPGTYAINENFEYDERTGENNAGRRSAFLSNLQGIIGANGSSCYTGTGVDNYCRMVSANDGCIYITHDCHNKSGEPGRSGRHCYKRIACAEENGFNHSFINAANRAKYGDRDEIRVLPTTTRGEDTLNVLYNSSLNSPYILNYTKLDGRIGSDGKLLYDSSDGETDRYVAPACIYEINACNDTEGEGIYGGGCYRKIGCDEENDYVTPESYAIIYEGHNLEEDWALWFRDQRPVCNDLTRCYKATSCELNVGAYSASPNTSFFIVADSTASGLTCYRGIECNALAGAYTSAPNTSFFVQIDSQATGSTCYRGEACHLLAGAYSSTPNTSFFITITSEASGSTAYRAERENEAAGAYTSTPNTSFFKVIDSLASGSTAYRAEREHAAAGAYSITPNTSFFKVIDSFASGSTAYRAEKEHVAAGAYSSTPNTSFFITITSQASGSTSYRAESGHEAAGAYGFSPNTSFFKVIYSSASGSTAYRAEKEHEAAGAYSSTPNTSFFITVESLASGLTCYRGTRCRDLDAGVYTTSPNTEFFSVISSHASGSSCYRAEGCGEGQGSYTSAPNTSFFITIGSSASGSNCYRGQSCYEKTGAYEETPNTSFFVAIQSIATGLTCYRGESCDEIVGAYSSTPNTVFFNYLTSKASGSTCYRGKDCSQTANAAPNTSFFNLVDSKASGSICYRSSSCHIKAGAYSSTPNTSFFEVLSSMNAMLDSTCYRGVNCHIKAGAYSSNPNTSFFITVESVASGSTSYRAIDTRTVAGAYTSTPNTSFFFVIISKASGSIAYRAEKEHELAGAYSSAPNTSFFLYNESVASGSTAYRATEVHIPSGAYTSTPNTSFFSVIKSFASGSISYRAESANFGLGSYTSSPNTSFFDVAASLASGSESYRGGKANEKAGAYSSSPNTSFFFVIKSLASGSTAYRAESAHIAAGAYSSAPNTSFFMTNSSLASGSTAYRAYSVCIDCGSYTSRPNTSFFTTIISLASGSDSYRAKSFHMAAGAYSSAPNTVYFETIASKASGSTCYRGEKCAPTANPEPNTSYFNLVNSKASGSICYRSVSCNFEFGAYSSSPNTSFFNVDKAQNAEQDSRCYRVSGCAKPAGAYDSPPNTSYFNTIHSLGSSIECFRADECAFDLGAYSSTPNTSFFSVSDNKASGSTCYRGDNCHEKAGSYSTSPNTDSFFITITSEASGSTCYRATNCVTKKGAYTSSPNTSFFITIASHASGSTCYRSDSCNLDAGAYVTAPNTARFFTTIMSKGSGSTCYRAQSCRIARGSYEESPNTSFFNTVLSQGSGSTCYRGTSCSTKAGAYKTTPNTVYFVTIFSKASGSTCYRGEKCAPTANAVAETNFFKTVASKASGSICYRSTACNTEVGAYSSIPNTSFFNTETSTNAEQDSTCYRGTDCRIPAGSYSVTPSASYFKTILSKASGTTCYRAERCASEQGAYTPSPNTSFFITTASQASGSTCYRATACYALGGAYDVTPNIDYFNTIKSIATDEKECFRADKCAGNKGAYTSSPNTSFFITIASHASGSTCYRSDSCNLDAGAYVTVPNTARFFITIMSKGSGSTCYRATECLIAKGAYEESPNTSFFNTVLSEGSGSTCYRGTSCSTTAGAYKTIPNTVYFETIASKASGSTCYRGEKCASTANAVAETNFFKTVASKASGSICYRSTACNTEVGAYSSIPNTSFFNTETSTNAEQDSTCYRGTDCRISAGSYSVTPSASYFKTILSKASGTTCYRAERCASEQGAYTPSPNTSFFITTASQASGSTCYRATACYALGGAYDVTPNINYFNTIKSIATDEKECFRADKCAGNKGAYTSKPNTSFFNVLESFASGSRCYRGDGCHTAAGSYSSKPNTSFFLVAESTATGKICWRGTDCHNKAGSYSSEPNTVFFKTVMSQASGKTCYRQDGCLDDAGSYASYANVNTKFFIVTSSEYAGQTCYRWDSCNVSAGSYDSVDSTYFESINSVSPSSKTCYRATSCTKPRGAYSATPNTLFFVASSKTATGITCYRGLRCNTAVGAYTSKPNTSYFALLVSKASGSTCYRSDICHEQAGAYSSSPNINIFAPISSQIGSDGVVCYRAGGCREPTPNNCFFSTASTSYGVECTYATGANYPNTAAPYDTGVNQANVVYNPLIYTYTTTSTDITLDGSTYTSYYPTGCKTNNYWYETSPNAYFTTFRNCYFDTVTYKSSAICGMAEHDCTTYGSPKVYNFCATSNNGNWWLHDVNKGNYTCSSGNPENASGVFPANGDNGIFVMTNATINVGDIGGTGKKTLTASYPSGCNTSNYWYTDQPASTLFFQYNSYQIKNAKTTCGSLTCNKVSRPKCPTASTSVFTIESSTANGYKYNAATPNINDKYSMTGYRVTGCNSSTGNYTSKPNSEFFGIQDYNSDRMAQETYSWANCNNVDCYRATTCSGGSNTVSPNTSFFTIVSSQASGLTCYRGDSCNSSAGAYDETPNTEYFFNTVSSASPSSKTCYRGISCLGNKGAYTSSPNTSFFMVTASHASGSTCYRGISCNFEAGAYTAVPNTARFFLTAMSKGTGSTCYRATACRIARGSYEESPNTSFFNIASSQSSGSKCYRGTGCRTNAGAYKTTPNTLFFETISSQASGSTCYRGVACKNIEGSFNAKPNTSFFLNIFSKASGSICYRATACHTAAGAYDTTPNVNFFSIAPSNSTGLTCFRGTACNTSARAIGTKPSTSFFLNEYSIASGSTCYRIKSCHTAAGAYSSSPSTDYFQTVSSSGIGHAPCFRGVACNTAACASATQTQTTIFTYSSSKASGSTCYRASGCAAGYCATEPNTAYFVTSKATECTTSCYKQTSCKCGAPGDTGYCSSDYFIVGSNDLIVANSTCGGTIPRYSNGNGVSSNRYCLKDTIVPGKTDCHLTVDERCKHGVEGNASSGTVCDSQGVKIGKEAYVPYYTWSDVSDAARSKKCGASGVAGCYQTVRTIPMQCNEAAHSYNTSLEAQALSSGTNGNVSGPTDIINSIWSNGITYGSIFDEKANTSIDGHEMACGPNVTTGFDGIQCFVACSCASGWFDTKQDALAAVGTSANNSNLNFAPSGGASSGAPSVSVSSNIPVTTMSGTTTLITFSDAGDGVVQAQTNRQYAFGGQKSCFKRVGPTCPNEYFSLTAAEKAAQEAAGKVCTEDPSNPGCYKCEDKCYFIVSKVGTGIADPNNGTTKVKFKIKRVKQDGVTPAPATPIDSGTGLFGIEYVLYSYFDMALIGSWDNGVMHDAGIVPPSCGNDCPEGTEHAITGSSTHVTSNLLWYTDIIKVSDAVDETLSTYKWHSSTAGHPEECSTGAGRYTYMEDDETYEYMCYEWPGNRTRSYQYYINEDIFDDPMDFEATVTPIDSSGEITIEYYRAGDAGVMAAEPQEWTVATFNNKTACEIVVEHCPEGYIESIIEPNSDYFTYEVDYGVTNNTKCYKITGCKPGYSEVGSSACAGGTFFDYHCYKSPDDYPVYFNLNQNSSNTWQPMGKCEKPIGSNSLLPDDLKVERLTFIDELSQTFVKTYTDKKLLCTGDLRYLQDIGGGGPVTDTFGGNHSFKTDIETAILGVEGVSLTGDDYIPISHGDVFTHEGKCLRLLIDDQPTSCMDYPVYFRYSRSIEDGRTKFNVYMKCTVGGGPGNWSVKGITYRAPGAPSVSLLLNKIIPCTGEFNPMPIAEITPIGSPQSITIVNVDLLKPGASNSLDTISNGDDFYYDGNCLNLNERFEEDICPDGYFLTSPQLTTAEQEIFSIASTSGTDGRTCYALGCKSPYVGSKPYNKIYHTYTHSELGLTNVSCYKVGKEIPAELQLHIASSVHKDGSSCNYDYLYNEPSPDNRSRLEAGDTAWNLYEIQQDGVTITTNNDDSYGNIRISVSKIYPSGNSAWAVGPTVDCEKDQLENLCSYGGIVFYTHDCGSSEACSCPALTCEAKGAYNDRLDITYTWQDQGNGQTRSMTKLYNNIRCVIARFGNGNF